MKQQHFEIGVDTRCAMCSQEIRIRIRDAVVDKVWDGKGFNLDLYEMPVTEAGQRFLCCAECQDLVRRYAPEVKAEGPQR